MAWDANTRQYTLSAEMFDYQGNSKGALGGVIKGDVTYEYYTDLKQIASLTTVNDNYIFGNLISLTLTSGDGDTRNLGYFCVKSVSKKERQGMVLKEYELVSILYKIQTIEWHYQPTIAGVYNIKQALDYEFGSTSNYGYVMPAFDSSYASTSHDFASSPLSVDRGSTFLDLMQKILSTYNWVANPDGINLKFEPYVNPNTKASKFTFTLDNGTISGDVEYKDGRYDTFNGIGGWYDKDNVVFEYNEGDYTGDEVSQAGRQQTVESDEQVDSLSPVTLDQMKSVIHAKMVDAVIVRNEYEFDGIYAGLHAGDACTITLSDGTHKCMVKSLKLTIDKAMKCHYTLKDFTNG